MVLSSEYQVYEPIYDIAEISHVLYMLLFSYRSANYIEDIRALHAKLSSQLGKGKGGNSDSTTAPVVEPTPAEPTRAATGGEGGEGSKKGDEAEVDGNEVANPETLEFEQSSIESEQSSLEPYLPAPQNIQEVPDVPEMFQTPLNPTRRGYRSPSPSPSHSQPPTLPAEELELEMFKATLPKQRPVAAPLRGGGLESRGDSPEEVDDDPYLHVPASADDSNCDTWLCTLFGGILIWNMSAFQGKTALCIFFWRPKLQMIHYFFHQKVRDWDYITTHCGFVGSFIYTCLLKLHGPIFKPHVELPLIWPLMADVGISFSEYMRTIFCARDIHAVF